VIKQALVTRDGKDLATKIYVNAFAMASEVERDLISQRTRSALARVKSQGKKLGNPRLALINRGKINKANSRAENLRSVISALIKNGFTQRQIAKELNAIGVRTSEGYEFKLATVQRILKRLELSTKH
jgi:DNA invertase Pin-like site-specific DNA recombinase